MMNTVIINAVYWPEPVVSAQLGRDLARHLVGLGDQVLVLCPSPSRPAVADYSELRPSRKALVKDEEGVSVVRLPSFTAPQSKLLARLRESYSFGHYACGYLNNISEEVDVIYVNSWPLLSQALIARYCSRNKIPMVLHIQDIYPESLTNKFSSILRFIVSRLLMRLDRWTASKASHIITISDNMRDVYVKGRGIASKKVSKVLNWVDETPFSRMPNHLDACRHYAVDETKLTFFYLGNIGPVACVEFLIEAFHNAAPDNTQFVIAGDGSSKARCVELAKQLGNPNIHFVSDPDVDNSPLLLSLAHVCLLPMRKGAGMSSIPSKLMAYLFAGRPVLASVDLDCDTAACIVKGECGWVGEPGNQKWLTEQILEITKIPLDHLRKIGFKGKQYGLNNFSKSQGLQKIKQIIKNSANGTR